MKFTPWSVLLFTVLTVFSTSAGHSQVVKSVVLDSVVVAAVSKGFDVTDFIEMVKSDTSFLRAFRYLRNSPHEVSGDIKIYDRKNRIAASRFRTGEQVVEGNRRWVRITGEKYTGRFYDRKSNPDTYTAELFDDIFFYRDTLPVLDPSVSISASTQTNNSSNISKLKKLVFNPGAGIDGVPIIGPRMAIFDDHMSGSYNYYIKAESFGDSIPCYVFSCEAKPGTEDFTVVKYLNTWFNRKTFQIVFREYRVQYSGIMFDFDVTMRVFMSYSGSSLYPSRITYSGYWDLPLKKAERADFELLFKLLDHQGL